MSGELIRSIPCPGADCYGLTFDGRDLYVVADTAHAIYQISILDGSIRFSFGSYDAKPRGICYDGRSVWCMGDNSNGLVHKAVPGGEILQLFPAVSSAAVTTFFINGQIFNGTYGEQYQVDIVTGTSIRAIGTTVGSVYGATHDGRTIWATDDTNAKIHQISLDSGTLIRSFDSPTANPRGIATDGRSLWILETTGDKIYQVAI